MSTPESTEQEFTQEPRLIVPREKLAALIAKAYELSSPQGLGLLHFRAGGLDEAVIAKMIAEAEENGREHGFIGMDYVLGRAVKLSIVREGKEWFMWERERWFDHSDEAFAELKAVIA